MVLRVRILSILLVLSLISAGPDNPTSATAQTTDSNSDDYSSISSEETSSTDESGGISTFIIAIAIILVVSALVLCVCCICRCMRKKNEEQPQQDESQQIEEHIIYKRSPPPSDHTPKSKPPPEPETTWTKIKSFIAGVLTISFWKEFFCGLKVSFVCLDQSVYLPMYSVSIGRLQILWTSPILLFPVIGLHSSFFSPSPSCSYIFSTLTTPTTHTERTLPVLSLPLSRSGCSDVYVLLC